MLNKTRLSKLNVGDQFCFPYSNNSMPQAWWEVKLVVILPPKNNKLQSYLEAEFAQSKCPRRFYFVNDCDVLLKA